MRGGTVNMQLHRKELLVVIYAPFMAISIAFRHTYYVRTFNNH